MPPNIKIMEAKKDVKGLVKALRHGDLFMRGQAALALVTIRDARAVKPLIASLGDKGGSTRKWAAFVLGNIGDARAVQPLIAALGDKDENVRSEAANALGNIGDARAVQPLIAALGDKDENVRSEAANALEKLEKHGPEAVTDIASSELPGIEEKICSGCGFKNPPKNTWCDNCGNDFN